MDGIGCLFEYLERCLDKGECDCLKLSTDSSRVFAGRGECGCGSLADVSASPVIREVIVFNLQTKGKGRLLTSVFRKVGPNRRIS
jgi:hypothetical protein